MTMRVYLCEIISRAVTKRQRHSLVATALLSKWECRRLRSPCGCLDVLMLNVGKDCAQRSSENFACCLDAPSCGGKKVG